MYFDAMATCHTITRVHGKIIGDPLDVKMFEACEWELNENTEADDELLDEMVLAYVHPKD